MIIFDFSAQESTPDTGLQRNRAGYRDLAIGRWTSQDPLGFDSNDSNLYRYAFNNPTARKDPTGEQSLSITTVTGPHRYKCGSFEWRIQWALGEDSPKGGYVVQHLKVTYAVTDCKCPPGELKNYFGNKKDSYEYWEAWKVDPKKKVTVYVEQKNPQADDGYTNISAKGVGTQGKITYRGSAAFYEDLTLPAKADFKQKNPETLAGVIPSTTTNPELKGGTAPVKHELTAEWNCCPGVAEKDRFTNLTTVPRVETPVVPKD